MLQENIKTILVVVIAIVFGVGAYQFMGQVIPVLVDGDVAFATDATEDSDENADLHMGYIKAVTQKDGVYSIVIDYATMLNGESASQARLEDGECSLSEGNCDVPGFYIQNSDPVLHTLELAPNAKVIMATWSHAVDGNFNYDDTSLDVKGFTGLFDGSTKLTPEGEPADYFKDMPYWITLENGVVVEIREQYLP